MLQVLLQPSPLVLFPSSQVSPKLLLPFPQILTQVVGLNIFQDHPASTFQVELHPSPLLVLPSSQFSPHIGFIRIPSPQQQPKQNKFLLLCSSS